MTRSCATSWCAYAESYEEKTTMTLICWYIFFGTSHRHTVLTCHIFVGLPTILPKIQRWKSWQVYILFWDLGWQTNFRKSLRSWRLGGDFWVLKLVTRFIRKTCVWAAFCFQLGLKYRQSNMNIGHPDRPPYAWWFFCSWLCFLFPRQLG